VAVHRRAYRPYEGPLTAERWRFLVLPRYGLLELFESRALTAFFVLCFVPFLIEASAVYVSHSAAARALLQLSPAAAGDLEVARPEFFMGTLIFQGALAFLLTAWVAPVLVSPDLVNGALPLFLSRPFSRAEYVLGKASVLALLLSLITWVPGLVLFALEAGLTEGWGMGHLRIVGALFAGAWVWILVLTLVGLALSAWIRWRIVASGALAGVFFMGSAFGEMWKEILGNPWGRVTNLSYLIGLVWRDLFGVFEGRQMSHEMFNDGPGRDLPTWAAWAGLSVAAGLCVWILDRRLRAREVVS
jgi:ABC-2 type transport system permease protein